MCFWISLLKLVVIFKAVFKKLLDNAKFIYNDLILILIILIVFAMCFLNFRLYFIWLVGTLFGSMMIIVFVYHLFIILWKNENVNYK